MNEKSRWQEEFDALPEWAQKMVKALTNCPVHSFGRAEDFLVGDECANEFTACTVVIHDEDFYDWSDGLNGMLRLAKALTAPWPPPPPPERERREVNLVEFLADEDDCAFDQPCAFGHRVEGHAVYCHNTAWPGAPRKCHRNRSDYLHEDCPGFVQNPDWQP